MDLAMAFGEPSVERFMSRITHVELLDWIEYARMRGLLPHLSYQVARLTAFRFSSKKHPIKPEDLLLLPQRTVPQAGLAVRLSNSMKMIAAAIKARRKKRG